jgi:hypothetical protein
MKFKFRKNVEALMGQYNNNIRVLTNESTIQIFQTAFRDPTWQIKITTHTKMRKGCFYIIKYNYNGNKLWCPILTLDYKVKDNKNILYAINLDYLPYKYKIIFFDVLFHTNKIIINRNEVTQNVLKEKPLDLTLEGIYKFLQINGKKEYSMTAFDILKIEKVYAISTSILERFIFLTTKYINKMMMLETLEKNQDQIKKDKMKKKIEKYDEILKLYEDDVELYYKSLRNFESNLKLFDE